VNKQSDQWRNAPVWVRIGLCGIGSRRTAIKYELSSAAVGCLCLGLSFVNTLFFAGFAMFAAAYLYAVTIRWVDNAGLW